MRRFQRGKPGSSNDPFVNFEEICQKKRGVVSKTHGTVSLTTPPRTREGRRMVFTHMIAVKNLQK